MIAEPLESQAFVPGRHFGRYEVLCELARGGMGVVAVGRLQGVHGVRRLVALKIIHPHLTRDEQYTRMFVREAEIASLVHHGNAVPVLELGQEGAQYFLVMEYFPSFSLSHAMRQAARREVQVPFAFSAAVIADACAGLHAAHELRDGRGELLGVVHRDATPSNLLLGEDGAVKVTDFGVARAASALVDQLTGESAVAKGKLAYLSPEQVHGEPADRRSDLFTLGVVLHELLGGRGLFRGENDLALARAIMDARIPDVREVNPEVPRSLAHVVARALERDREKRYQTAAEMQESLLDAVHSLPVVSRGAFIRQLLGDEFASRREEIATAETVLGVARPSIASSPPSGPVALVSSRPGVATRSAGNEAPTRPELSTPPVAAATAPVAGGATLAPGEKTEVLRGAAPGERAARGARWIAPLIVVALLGVGVAASWGRREPPRSAPIAVAQMPDTRASARPGVSRDASTPGSALGVATRALVEPASTAAPPVASEASARQGEPAPPASSVRSPRVARGPGEPSVRSGRDDRARDARPSSESHASEPAQPSVAPTPAVTTPPVAPVVRPRLEM